MKKKLMMCFAAAVEKNRDPWIESNLEALSRTEGLFGPMCTQTRTPGTYYMKDCRNCNGQFGYYAMDMVSFCVNRL
ncbi:MAG: hypothetical protein IJU27_03390 [Bacteroidales bacterium]|nr:hypothetical protein [Bacteroidales bacterium]